MRIGRTALRNERNKEQAGKAPCKITSKIEVFFDNTYFF